MFLKCLKVSFKVNISMTFSYLNFFVYFSLAFSVTLFCTEAVIAIAIILLRRSKLFGGELGGPVIAKYTTSAFMFSLWIIYITLSTLEVYGVIKGF